MRKGKSLYTATALVALLLATTGCMKHDRSDIRRQSEQIIQEFHDNFQAVVMGGKGIDPAQTWNTAVTTRIAIKTDRSGTLRIYTTDPATNADAAWLAEASVIAGSTTQFVIARPLGASLLYAAVFNDKGNIIDVISFDATAAEVSTCFYSITSPIHTTGDPSPLPSYSFTPRPKDDDYAMLMPEDVHPLSDYYLYFNKVTNYRLGDATDVELSPFTGMAYYYCDGKHNITFNGTKDTGNIRFYILPDADIHFVGDYSFLASLDHVFYVAAGATLTFDGKLSSNAVIYNQGKVVVHGDIAPATGSVIYNQGVLTGDNALNISKDGVELVNDGTLTVAGNVNYDNAGSYVLNRGLFTVGKTFTIKMSNNPTYNGFQMADGAGVVTTDFTAEGPCRLFLGSRSVFHVTNKATLHFTNRFSGIYGPTKEPEGYGVFHAKSIATAKSSSSRTVPTGFMASYHGYLAVAYDESHFGMGLYATAGADAVPYYCLESPSFIDQTAFLADTYNVEATNRNPGFTAGGQQRSNNPHYTYFAFEDLRGGDTYTYNDAVVRIGTPVKGVADVELCAVGTRLESYLLVGDQRIGNELHKEFGIAVGNSKTVEGSNVTTSGVKTAFKTIGTVTIPDGQSVADLDIRLQVTKESGDVEVIGAPQVGTVPYRLVVSGSDDGKWFWPREPIHKAYAKFRDWGTDRTTATDWYKTPKGGVIKW